VTAYDFMKFARRILNDIAEGNWNDFSFFGKVL
jgi:hypothetical protein